jgi:DMSO/TMAO reductase YedYZ molybdopterin-dependent catalytic subunit
VNGREKESGAGIILSRPQEGTRKNAMEMKMRVLTSVPFNAETPPEHLRSWITANSVFFHRNQSQMNSPVDLKEFRLRIRGEVENPGQFTFDEILRLPKAMAADTLEGSGNGRALLKEKAFGNPWTIGGVGNAVWGGVWLRELLEIARPKSGAAHVAFEGLDEPDGPAKIKFIRSLPLKKATASTLLAYEMNGEPLPLKHGFPLRALALGWVGASSVKWLTRITLRERPFEGHYMDQVYRLFQKGQDPKTGTVVTRIPLKTIITQPLQGESIRQGRIVIQGAAYGGGNEIAQVEVSTDGGNSWVIAEWIGPQEPFAWRHWQHKWSIDRSGQFRILARATDAGGQKQPLQAQWNVLGYGNNGVEEHSVQVHVQETNPEEKIRG